METVKIPDRETGGWEITGDQIARVSTDNGRRLRWSVNAVWKLADGTYALYRASMSVLYHRPDTSCRTYGREGEGTGPQSGEECRARDLPPNAEPCDKCEPPWADDLRPDEKVRFEYPRQSVVICESPNRVIKEMTSYRRLSGEEVSSTSGPARGLLEQCRANDPGFADARPPMTRIG
jgi:hypothetical protein